MYTSESQQYTAVLTPSHIPDPYPILCPPLEQNVLPTSQYPFRIRPPNKLAVQERFRTAQIQDIAQENVAILNNYTYSDRSSPDTEKRNSPDIEFSAYTTRAKSTSPTNSDDKSASSSSPNLHSTSPDSSYCDISMVSHSKVIEKSSGQGGVVETGFNQLGSTLYIQEANVAREDEVKSDNDFSVWDFASTTTTPPLARAATPPSVQESHSNSSSPSRLPPTPTQTEPGLVGGLQNKVKPVLNGVGRGSIGRGVKSKKRLNSLGEHNVGILETAPMGWGELPMNPKENFDDGTEFWGQPEKPIIKPDNEMLMYLKAPYTSFDPYEMNTTTTKHSSQYTSLTDQQKRILQEIMQSNFDFPSAISDETMGMGGLTHSYSHNNMGPMYPRHFSESNLQGPSMQQFIMQRNVINLLMKQQYLQMQKGLTLEQAIQYLLHETKAQQQKLMSSLYQQGNKYSPQINQHLQVSNMFINLLQQQLSNVTAPQMEGFPMGNQYHKPMYVPSMTEPHTPSYDHHYPSTPQEYQMGYPHSQAPRQGQAKNQQWIVQQLVKFHMFNNDTENKNESKSIGKDPMNMNFSKSLDPSYHAHDAPMKYNIIRSTSLMDPHVTDYSRQRKMNSSMSSLHTEESYNFSELPPSLYDFEDKLVEPEELVFQEPYDRVPPSPSFNTQGHTFSPGALAFYPPGHFHEPENEVSNMFSSLPATLHPSNYEPPSPRVFYPNKSDNTPLDYEAYTPADLYQAKLLEVESLPPRPHNKSPNQFTDKYNPLLMHGNKGYPAPYTPQYLMEGGTNSSIGMKTDPLTNSLPTGLGMERSDAAWLLLTGLNVRMDKTQLERYFTPLGSTSVAHSVKNRTAMLTFKQAADAEAARNGLKTMLGADAFDTCEICTDPNELSYFISKFAESPRSPIRDTTPWGYTGLSGSIDSTFASDSSISFSNSSEYPPEDISQFEEQIWLNYLPNDLI